jgi:DNA mismatch repair protein MutL
MYLIDQHAAHERVLFEHLRQQQDASSVASQGLLSPQTVELTSQQQVVLEEQAQRLKQLGFALETFGASTVLVRALPAVFRNGRPGQILAGVLDDLSVRASLGSRSLDLDAESRLMAIVCKRAAIKAGQTLSYEEMRELIHQLEQTENPRTCPHGRPTMIHLSQGQLAREFGRR